MIKQTEIKNGLFIFLGIGIFFLLVDSLGYSDNFYLKLFNFVFVLLGVNWTLKHYANKGQNYLNLYVKGFLTAMIGVVLSIIGIVGFIAYQSQEFSLAEYSTTLIPAESVTHFVLALFAEGLASSIIVVFILMQKWKNEPAVTSKAN